MVLPTTEIRILGIRTSTKYSRKSSSTQIFSYRVVWGNKLIGLHVTKGCLAAPYYRNFLENELPLQSEEAPLAAQRRMWLQHDGALVHFGRAVIVFLLKIMKEDG
jgi:hypothetical protein